MGVEYSYAKFCRYASGFRSASKFCSGSRSCTINGCLASSSSDSSSLSSFLSSGSSATIFLPRKLTRFRCNFTSNGGVSLNNWYATFTATNKHSYAMKSKNRENSFLDGGARARISNTLRGRGAAGLAKRRRALVVERHGVGPLVPRPDLQFLLDKCHVEALLPRKEERGQRAARAAADDGHAGALAAHLASRGREDESEEPRGAAHRGPGHLASQLYLEFFAQLLVRTWRRFLACQRRLATELARTPVASTIRF